MVLQDHFVFPITLLVSKLAGTGQDSVFMGVVRETVVEDKQLVKVWCTTNGTILCADQRFSDWFGVPPAEIVGRSFSSLGADIEGLDRWGVESLSCLLLQQLRSCATTISVVFIV